ncbi:uncharacterized protein LOC144123324 [Amblyomma americanum]
MRCANPFVFIVQLALGLILHGTASGIEPTEIAWVTSPVNGTRFHACDSLTSAEFLRPHYPGAATCEHLSTHDLLGAPPHEWATYTLPRNCIGSGLGGTTSMRCANPFVFIVQVSRRFGKCFRSSDRFLVVLPCPQLCLEVFDVAVFLCKLLLLSGDVETNPGPEMAQIAKQLKDIAEDIKEIKEKRLTDIENKLDAITLLETKVQSCQTEISRMNHVIESLEKKIDDLENRSRRSNLIVYGLPEDEEESTETLEQAVNKSIIQDTLKLDPVAFERIHRLGRPQANKNRPVIFKLLDARNKSAILKQGFKLKDTKYAIGEDFSPRIREIRKKLWNSAKENRQKGDKVSLAFDKLFINRCAFVWDHETNDKVPLKKNEEQEETVEKRSPPTTRGRARLKH